MQFRGKVSFGFEEQRTVTRPTVYIEDRGQHISTATGRPASLLSRTRQTWVKNIFYFYFLFCRIYHGPLAESKNVTLKFLINVTFKNISMSAKKINSNKKLKLFLSFWNSKYLLNLYSLFQRSTRTTTWRTNSWTRTGSRSLWSMNPVDSILVNFPGHTTTFTASGMILKYFSGKM